jgi:predicted Holliday junction resolvase-like endonuclease
MFWIIVSFFLSILLAYFVIKNIKLKIEFEQKVKEAIEKREKEIKEEAIKRSARVLAGKTLEKLIPFLEKFPHNPQDARWIGDPIDFVIFDGLSSGEPSKITFCEIKSGEGKLTKQQEKIREIVKRKKVEWSEFRI